MIDLRDTLSGYGDTWRWAVDLGKPVVGNKFLQNLMSTTDILITASLSPAAVVGLALADLYHNISQRINGGIAEGTGILISQDKGAEVIDNINEALSFSVVISFLIGFPVAAVGILFGETLLSLVGADPRSAQLGAAYLSIIVLAIPVENVSMVNSRALQSVGDTWTPSVIGVVSNVINILLSVFLGIGLAGAPDLGIVGVGVGTATAKLAEFVLYQAAIYRERSLSLVRPERFVVLKQLVQLGLPQIGMGLVTSLAVVPFNSILLGLGTSVNAGYQLAWRFYQQLVGPFASSTVVVTNIIVGQTMGDGEREDVNHVVTAILLLAGIVSLITGALLILGVGEFGGRFATDGPTTRYAHMFAVALGVSAVFGILNNTFSSALSATSETRIPLIERIVGMFGGMVGVSYVLGNVLGWGVTGALIGVVSTYLSMLLISSGGFLFTRWDKRAEQLMDQRESHSS